MSAHAGKGSAMHMEFVRVRFVKDSTPGPKKGQNTHLTQEDVAEVRKLLRTEMSVAEIASHFGIESQCLRIFIKRRRICDLKARRDFISLQRSLARAEARESPR